MSEFETFEQRLVREKVEAAEARADVAQRELEKAQAELAKVKADVHWCMRRGIIADLIFHSDPAPAAMSGYVEQPHPTDSELVAWLNKNARVTLGERSFVIAFDHGGVDNETLIPCAYNLRDLIGVCLAFRRESVEEEKETHS